MKREKIASMAVWIFLASLVFVVSGCGGGLAKDEAGKLITNSEGFKKGFIPVYFYLKARHVQGCSPQSDYLDDQWYNLKAKLPVWEKLESMGYIKLVKSFGRTTTGECRDRGEEEIIDLSLTDKGKNIFIHEKDNYWKTEVGKKVFVGVNDVLKVATKPTIFQVTYTWKYEASGIANTVKPIIYELQSYKDKNLNEPQEGVVWIAKYDDGRWEVMWGQPGGLRVIYK